MFAENTNIKNVQIICSIKGLVENFGHISKLVSARFMRDFEQLAFNWEGLICQQWLNFTLVH